MNLQEQRSSSDWSCLPVTALLADDDRNQLLVAQGSHILLIGQETGIDRLDRVQIFKSSTIHGFNWLSPGRVLVWGSKSTAVIDICDNLKIEQTEVLHQDWLLCCVAVDATCYLLTAHNSLLKMENLSSSLLSSAAVGPCILYAGLLVPIAGPGPPLVIAGTVLGTIQIWHPITGEQLHCLEGHDGVIFSIAYSNQTIVSTSDDRSAIIWRVSFPSSVNNASIDDWASATIVLAHRLYAHVARIHTCLLTDAMIYTAGEDGRLCAWDREMGRLMETKEPHGGSAIWSICAGTKGVVISGAQDGSVRRSFVSKEKSQEIALNGVKPRSIKCLGGRVLVVGEQGELILTSVQGNAARVLLKCSEFANYCILEIEEESRRFVMCGLNGHITVATLSLENLENINSIQRTDCGKIHAAALIGANRLLISDSTGKVIMFNHSLEELASGILPLMKSRWFTVAISWNEMVVLGDRCGGIHCWNGTLEEVVSWKTLHGKQGVTDLLVTGTSSLWSSGRDGCVRRFVQTEQGAIKLVQIIQCNKGDWVARLIVIETKLAYLMWRGAMLQARRLRGGDIGQADCGGGHRSWDVTSSGDVVYVKEGRVLCKSLWNKTDRILLDGGHSQQIDCIHKFRLLGRKFVVTGGEETVIRVHEVVNSRTVTEVAAMRGHLSSIKCLALLNKEDSVILISAGGRAEVRLWRLTIADNDLVNVPLARLLLNGDDHKRRRKPWREIAAETRCEAETRVMAMCCQFASDNNTLAVFLACSDAFLRVCQYDFSDSESQMSLTQTVQTGEHCLLQLQRCDNHIIVTGDTGGSLVVWSVKSGSTVDRRLGELTVHQSGVNCLQVDQRNLNEWLILTGGDDCAITLVRLKISYGEVGELTKIWSNTDGCSWRHSAQVTGLKFLNSSIAVSISVDQRLAVWTVHNNSLKCIAAKVGNVADPQGLEVWHHDEHKVACMAVGVGMELAIFDLEPR